MKGDEMETDENGAPVFKLWFLPKGQFEIVRTWDVAGLALWDVCEGIVERTLDSTDPVSPAAFVGRGPVSVSAAVRDDCAAASVPATTNTAPVKITKAKNSRFIKTVIDYLIPSIER